MVQEGGMVRMVGASSLGGWARGDLVMTHTPRPVAIQGMKTNSIIEKRYYEKIQAKTKKLPDSDPNTRLTWLTWLATISREEVHPGPMQLRCATQRSIWYYIILYPAIL